MNVIHKVAYCMTITKPHYKPHYLFIFISFIFHRYPYRVKLFSTSATLPWSPVRQALHTHMVICLHLHASSHWGKFIFNHIPVKKTIGYMTPIKQTKTTHGIMQYVKTIEIRSTDWELKHAGDLSHRTHDCDGIKIISLHTRVNTCTSFTILRHGEGCSIWHCHCTRKRALRFQFYGMAHGHYMNLLVGCCDNPLDMEM